MVCTHGMGAREQSNLLIVAKSRHSTQPSRQNRHMKYGIALLFATFGIIAAAQEEKPVPKDSVRVSIPGCSKGSAFVVTESPEGERTSIEIKTGRRFRLTGKKDLLKEIEAREGYVIEVTGIVRRNDLQGPGGISLGGGRVRIGGGPPVAGSGQDPNRAPQSANAILDVEGFRPLGQPCPK